MHDYFEQLIRCPDSEAKRIALDCLTRLLCIADLLDDDTLSDLDCLIAITDLIEQENSRQLNG